MKLLFHISALTILIATGCSTFHQWKMLQAYENPTADSSPADTTVSQVKASRDNQGRPATLLSAFYGLDDGLPQAANKGIGEGGRWRRWDAYYLFA
jgi:hypothetical protein